MTTTSLPSNNNNDNDKSTSTGEYDRLLYWLRSSFDVDSFVSDSLTIAPSPRGGHGLFATTDIAQDSLLFTVPREACITTTSVNNDPDCGAAFGKLTEKAGPGAKTVCLAGYVAKEYLKYLADESSSAYGPYLDTLPWERGWNDQEHVLFWDETEVEQWLMGSLCYDDSAGLRDEVQLARNILTSVVGPSILKARGEGDNNINDLLSLLPWVNNPKPAAKDITGLDAAVTAAFVIILTRSFNDDFDTRMVDADRLIPLLDMLNHDKDPSITFSTSMADGSVRVKARHDLVAGQEIFNSYREEEEINMPKHRFFSRFGFVPGVNENIKDLLANKSSFFFAKRQEI